MGLGKAIVLIGPRQVGKTTLIRSLLADRPHLHLNGDDSTVRALLGEPSKAKIAAVIRNHSCVFIDEAQRIPEIGLTAKIIVDEFPGIQLILSGSSAFELQNSTQEPLTGRKFEHLLYPISWEEFELHVGHVEAQGQIQERLIFGMYPDVINSRSMAEEVLTQLARSYLFRDILALGNLRKPELLERLLRALALQVGSEVSLNELSNLLGVDKATVGRYLELLEKAYVVFRLPTFSRNQRNEIKNGRKVFFYDNGIRNAIIQNLTPFDFRTDKGALWENFLISERMKVLAYHGQLSRTGFWRTAQQQEVDFLEERNGTLKAFEFKWKHKSNPKLPKTFTNLYPSATAHFIDQTNFRTFTGPFQ